MSNVYWNPMVPELSVRDFDLSLSFYCHLLGFDIRNQRSDPNFAYLESGQVQIMLEEMHTGSWDTGEHSAPLGRGVNFQIELDDISPIYQRLKGTSIKC